MGLLDRDRFEGRFRTGVHHVDISDIMRRMLKEELVDFEGKPLFPERRAYTVNYDLSPLEDDLYQQVTDYVRTEMNRADELAAQGGDGARRRNVVGFALTIIQRRLASSPATIYHSLRRRKERLERRVKEEEQKPRVARDNLIDLTSGLEIREEDDIDELPDIELEGYEEQVVDQASNALTIEELKIEIDRLKELEALAKQVRESGTDRKLAELRGVQNRAEMFDPQRLGRRAKAHHFHRTPRYPLVPGRQGQ